MKFLKEIKIVKVESDAKTRSSMNILPLGKGLCKLIFIDDCGNKLESGDDLKGGGQWDFEPEVVEEENTFNVFDGLLTVS